MIRRPLLLLGMLAFVLAGTATGAKPKKAPTTASVSIVFAGDPVPSDDLSEPYSRPPIAGDVTVNGDPGRYTGEISWDANAPRPDVCSDICYSATAKLTIKTANGTFDLVADPDSSVMLIPMSRFWAPSYSLTFRIHAARYAGRTWQGVLTGTYNRYPSFFFDDGAGQYSITQPDSGSLSGNLARRG